MQKKNPKKFIYFLFPVKWTVLTAEASPVGLLEAGKVKSEGLSFKP